MHNLVYVPGTPGAPTVELDGPVTYVGPARGIRGRSWSYRLGYRDMLSATRPAREAQVDLSTTPAQADAMRRVFDADVANGKPGTLVAEGEWRQRALFVETDPSYAMAGYVGMRLTLLLLDGAWSKLEVVQFTATEDGEPTGLDYPHDYPHDYAISISSNSVDTGLLSPSPVFLRIYGPAVSPYVVVGSNRYQLNVTVPSGGYVVVDGQAKTITLVAQDGTRTNAFASGERGSGAGGGSYIFEEVPAGYSTVSWDGSFGFDLGWYDMEGEPPWNRS